VSKEVKEAVLAKCGGMSYEEELENGWEYERRHYDGRSWHRLHKGCTTYDFDHRDADNDPCWQIAADILGIKQPEPTRPSDALLWEAFDLFEVMLDSPVTKNRRAMFAEWLATLPTDPLKADRELVVDAFEREDLERDLLNECYNYELINAVKRLAGMEVGNV
jgi:hypothetical protein